MAGKFIIGSNVMFIVGRGVLNNNAESATHYLINDAEKILSNRKDLTKYKIRNSVGRKDYVIGQVMDIIGNDSNIVSSIIAAKQFLTIEDALKFAEENPYLLSKIKEPTIYNEYYKKTKIKIVQPKELDVPIEESNSVKVLYKRISLSPTKRAAIYSKSGKVCAICGKPIKIDDFTVDHIKPLALGGSYDEDNLQATHRRCNLMKANLEEDEFFDNVNIIASNRMINNFDRNDMFVMARAIVRGMLNNANQ